MSDELRRLFVEAYRLAERQGKPDWREMNMGVLKNRLIYLTGGDFNERTHGKEKFGDLVADFPDLLRVDNSVVPPTVELLPDLDATRPHVKLSTRKRVRADLWKAILDFSSGKRYVWDDEKGLAREEEPEDQLEPLPTVGQLELTEWRAEFAAQVADTLAPNERSSVDAWQAKGLGTIALPMRLRGAWNQQLTRNVEERLNNWFADRHTGPKEVAAVVQTSSSTTSDVGELRSFIVSCIETMTREELERLQLPASVVLRNRNK